MTIWICQVYWIVEDIAIEIGVAAGEPNRFLVDEPPGGGVVVAGAVVVKPGFGINLAAGVSEGVGNALGDELEIAVGIIIILIDHSAGGVGD